MRILKISLLVFILSICIAAQNFWQITNGPYDVPTVYDFLPYNDSTIFLATDEGLIKSSDNGNSWDRINSYKVICLGTDKLNNIYFGISGHLKRSTDSGNSWTDITVYGAAIKDFVIPYRDTILVGSWDAWSSNSERNSNLNETVLSNGVFRSFDYGNTWTQVNNGIEYPGVYELLILSNGSLLVGTSGGGVYKSTNWGDLWIESNNGIVANTQGWRYSESFLELAPGEILTGTHLGLYYSSDYGDNWVLSNTGFNNNIASCFEMDDSGNIFAGCSLFDGVYFSTNMGNNWNYLGLNNNSINTLGWDSESKLYAGGLSAGLYRFMVEDSTWTHVYNQGYTPAEVTDLCLTNSGNLISSINSLGLHYTTDN
ncbi:MAG: hypothetical protein OEM46_08695, partial [Ignavibacteria bacterium]|nr:hypothetical protein [Ignavibacteria bacterium]